MVKRNDVNSLLHDFLLHMECDMKRSAKTIQNYDRYIKRFILFSKIEDPRHITEALVHTYTAQLDRAVYGRSFSLKQNTKNYYLVALRVFLRYLKKRNITSLDPKKVRLAPAEYSRDITNEEDIQRLISKPVGKTVKDLRDRAIVLLIVATGMRVSELCNLNSNDVDLSHGKVEVVGLRGNKRVMPISLEVRRILSEYLRLRTDKDTAFFVNNGKHTTVEGSIRLTPRSIQRIVNDYGVKAGVTEMVTPQSLRHAYAVSLLKKGTKVGHMRELLDHIHDTTTEKYSRSL